LEKKLCTYGSHIIIIMLENQLIA